jgi:polyisoprenoid-binding protein YceI
MMLKDAKTPLKHLVVPLLLAMSTGPLAAQTAIWTLDKAHSQVKFSVSHLVIAEVTGRFTDFDVELQQNDEDFSTANIEATINAASINTDQERRDNELRSDDFLNAEKYPTITFKSTSVEKTGEHTYRVNGDLTIREVTKAVVLDTKFNGTVVDPWGNTKAGYKATTTINRFDYGVRWNNVMADGGLVAGKDVEITLLMEFAKRK